LIAVGLLAATASAQTTNIYYGANDTVIRPQTQTWAGHYWHRVDNSGTPATGASSFAFSSAVTNVDLFNPLRAGRATLEAVNLVPVNGCEQLELMPSLGAPTDPDGAEIAQAFRNIMTTGTITTSITNNPQGSLEHINLILSMGTSPIWWFGYEGGGEEEVGSQGLALMHMSATMYDAALALNVSTRSIELMASMMQASWGWSVAAGLNGGVSEQQAIITGQASKADLVRDLVEQFLIGSDVHNYAAMKVNAHFGVYGQLPMIQANLSDCFILLDPFTGNMSGPFELGTALDGRGLLGFYSTSAVYELGTDVRYYSEIGCPIQMAPQPEQPGVPPCYRLIPPWTPKNPSPAPGNPGQWHCTTTPRGCSCWQEVFYEPIPPREGPDLIGKQKCFESGEPCGGDGAGLDPYRPAMGACEYWWRPGNFASSLERVDCDP
jgi:hypothetical protein